MADGRFDDLLLGLASKHKNVEELSYSILSFFERRTDLFHVMESSDEGMGFMPGVAEKMLFKHFGFFQQRYFSRAQPQFLYRGPGAPAEEERSVVGAVSTSMEISSLGHETAADAISSPSVVPTPADAADSSVIAKEQAASLPEKTKKLMRHISTWNGAVTSKYHWSQSISEVTVEVEVEPNCRSKDVEANLSATRLWLKCKGNMVLEGKLHEKVIVEDFMWYLDDNKVVMSMEKQRETWWRCVLEGDEEIDTTKVESTRTMDEYDGETQGAIRKIMFDQHQKAAGKATSDQIRTADMMKDAWNAPGSPFRGSDFDPTLLNLSGPVPDDFFEEVEKRRLEEARSKMDAER
mmetsp:Transcript_35748/g.98528  ORF Transcript_35748/g.98528 Transcript_35748/m.98528 type:complete len:350 (-) Transcript_35748:41-1090(-)